MGGFPMDKQAAARVATRVAERFLQAAQPMRVPGGRMTRLDPSLRRKINQRLVHVGLDESRTFPKPETIYSLAVQTVGEFGIDLESNINPFVFVDRSKPDGKADQGHTTLLLEWRNRENPFSPLPLNNSMLVFTFVRMPSGNFAGTAYLS